MKRKSVFFLLTNDLKNISYGWCKTFSSQNLNIGDVAPTKEFWTLLRSNFRIVVIEHFKMLGLSKWQVHQTKTSFSDVTVTYQQ